MKVVVFIETLLNAIVANCRNLHLENSKCYFNYNILVACVVGVYEGEMKIPRYLLRLTMKIEINKAEVTSKLVCG